MVVINESEESTGGLKEREMFLPQFYWAIVSSIGPDDLWGGDTSVKREHAPVVVIEQESTTFLFSVCGPSHLSYTAPHLDPYLFITC